MWRYRENDNLDTETIERYMQMPLEELEELMLREEQEVFAKMKENNKQ